MKKHIIIFIVSIVLIMAGSIWTIYEVFDYKLANNFKEDAFTTKTVSFEASITKAKVFVHADRYGKINITKNDEISIGTVKIEVTYFNQLFNVNYSSMIDDNNQSLLLSFNHVDEEENFNNFKRILDVTIDGLKNKTIYNYGKAFRPTINVFVNSSDLNVVKMGK